VFASQRVFGSEPMRTQIALGLGRSSSASARLVDRHRLDPYRTGDLA